jgi:hypothetical protein
VSDVIQPGSFAAAISRVSPDLQRLVHVVEGALLLSQAGVDYGDTIQGVGFAARFAGFAPHRQRLGKVLERLSLLGHGEVNRADTVERVSFAPAIGGLAAQRQGLGEPLHCFLKIALNIVNECQGVEGNRLPADVAILLLKRQSTLEIGYRLRQTAGIGVGIADLSEHGGFPALVAHRVLQRQRLGMKLDGFVVVVQLTGRIAEIGERLRFACAVGGAAPELKRPLVFADRILRALAVTRRAKFVPLQLDLLRFDTLGVVGRRRPELDDTGLIPPVRSGAARDFQAVRSVRRCHVDERELPIVASGVFPFHSHGAARLEQSRPKTMSSARNPDADVLAGGERDDVGMRLVLGDRPLDGRPQLQALSGLGLREARAVERADGGVYGNPEAPIRQNHEKGFDTSSL